MDMGGLVPAGVGKQRGCPWCSPGGTGSNLLAGMTPTFTWVRITYYFRPLCAKWLRWGGGKRATLLAGPGTAVEDVDGDRAEPSDGGGALAPAGEDQQALAPVGQVTHT